MKIGSLLKQLRLDAGLTQKELAKALGIAQSTIVWYEKNEREPMLSIVMLYAKYFNVTIDYLAGIEDDFGNKSTSDTTSAISSEERKIINDYRQLDYYGKKLINQTMDTLLLKSSSDEKNKNSNI
jgi:transcriptional regulator with XRE-family HTH domain